MQVNDYTINLTGNNKIYAELDFPHGKGPWKTIILFHGSGPSDRHALVKKRGHVISHNFDLLTERLVQAGYAVFRYDKRENYDINLIIQDAIEVTKFVFQLAEVGKILVYGWSEGVRVCAALYSYFPEISAMILQSGIAEGWSAYFSYILRELTVEKLEELDRNHDGILELEDFRKCEFKSTSITFSLYILVLYIESNGNMSFNKELDSEGKGKFSIKEDWLPLADKIIADPTYLNKFAENAPKEVWGGILDDIRRLEIPILILHGLNDGWISPIESVKIAMTARNHADIRLFKGLGHALSKVRSPLDDEGGVMEMESIETIVEWLNWNIK